MTTLILDPHADMGVLTNASAQTLAELLPALPIGIDALVRRLRADGGDAQVVPASTDTDAVVTYTDEGAWLYARTGDGIQQTLLVRRTYTDPPPRSADTSGDAASESADQDTARQRLAEEATKLAAAAQKAGLKAIDTPQVRERVDALFGAGTAQIAVTAVRHAPVDAIVDTLAQNAPALDELARSVRRLFGPRR